MSNNNQPNAVFEFKLVASTGYEAEGSYSNVSPDQYRQVVAALEGTLREAGTGETFVADVRRFTEAVGCTTDRFNVRQTALYIGLQLEEMAEKLEALGWDGAAATGGFFSDLVIKLRQASTMFKQGRMDNVVELGDREAMLDADVDLAWVTVGSALSQGADLLGAMREVARANLDKIGPDGTVLKDENGKVKKPAGWRGPDIAPYVLRETAAPATANFPHDDMGAEVAA